MNLSSQSKPPMTHRARRFALTALATAVLAGCAVAPPETLSTQDLLKLDQTDRSVMFAQQEPVTGPITLDEAIARAVKYNLQQRLALMERALEDDLVDVQKQGMLPKLTARAGMRARNNDYGSSSESLATGVQSLVPSTSQERDTHTADLQMTWNVLDFGLSYFGAKAQGNKALAAEERRRRVVADIIRQTRTAYWNAVTAERLKDRVTSTLAEARQTLEYARQTEQKRLVAPILALRYQRDLLNMVRQTEALDNELAQAKARLATLMNLPLTTDFTLAAPDASTLTSPNLAYELADLEALAMVRRPELREESYLARNAVLETRMSLLRLFPNASLFGGLSYDSNKYLANNNWADAGVQVSWNLLNVLSWPAISRAGESREQVAELRRQALRMTVLSQVHIAWLERQRAEIAFRRANELSRLQDAIQVQTENAARSSAETHLEVVRAKVETLLATRARDLSYAELVNAQNTIYQAAGIDPLPERIADETLMSLARDIAETNRKIESGHVEVPRLAVAEPAAVAAAGQAVAESVAQAVASEPAPAPLPALRTVSGSMWSHLGSVAGSSQVAATAPVESLPVVVR
ncbi:TolC family protein [Achromobacter seleniivolatilans]|uniref:TolC family protein n=1 Tax=Achromobacter seleniivolatilans TaxID=3047478 RepID=A0ABY9LW24_9BURK|nr:TolC family protein [Achromobacter sp. R39]WMD18984.1 TolC family protein [Achromobacter sp. R39]